MLVEILDNAVIVAGALVFIISGIVEVVKQATDLDNKYIPLLSLVIGFVIGIAIALGFNLPLAETILAGGIGGLGASGLYDNFKSV